MNISDEAVEAAAKAAYNNVEQYSTWEAEPEEVRKMYLSSSRRILEAAAHHIAAEAWDEGAATATYPDGSRVEDPRHLPPNPYRSHIDQ